jgi:hypothetical protein
MVPADNNNIGGATCDPGEVATGGGAYYSSGNVNDMVVLESFATANGDNPPVAWTASVYNADRDNSDDGNLEFVVRVVCASP